MKQTPHKAFREASTSRPSGSTSRAIYFLSEYVSHTELDKSLDYDKTDVSASCKEYCSNR